MPYCFFRSGADGEEIERRCGGGDDCDMKSDFRVRTVIGCAVGVFAALVVGCSVVVFAFSKVPAANLSPRLGWDLLLLLCWAIIPGVVGNLVCIRSAQMRAISVPWSVLWFHVPAVLVWLALLVIGFGRTGMLNVVIEGPLIGLVGTAILSPISALPLPAPERRLSIAAGALLLMLVSFATRALVPLLSEC